MEPGDEPPTRRQRTAQPTVGSIAGGAAGSAAHGLGRIAAAWRALAGEYRLASVAAVGLFLSMFLPWYSQTATGVAKGLPVTASDTLNAFQAFSWVEAAVLLVAIAVLFLCFTRGERRSYHLPGGDGTVLFIGGVWVCLLVFLRTLDHPEAEKVPGLSTQIGVHWGIFVTFLFGLLLAYAGWRLRLAHRPEPGPLEEAVSTGHAPAPRPRRRPPRTDDDTAYGPEPEDRPTRTMLPDEEPTRPARPTPSSARASGPPSTPAARQASAPAPTPAPRPPAPSEHGEQLTFDED